MKRKDMTCEGNIYPHDRISILAAVNHAASFSYSLDFTYLYTHIVRFMYMLWHLFRHYKKIKKEETCFQPEYFQCSCAFSPDRKWVSQNIFSVCTTKCTHMWQITKNSHSLSLSLLVRLWTSNYMYAWFMMRIASIARSFVFSSRRNIYVFAKRFFR